MVWRIPCYEVNSMIYVDIIAALIVGTLSGMGVGSGGLFMIYLSVFKDIPQLSAQGANLLFFLFSSGTSLFYNLRKRNILWNAVLFMSILGILGSLIGSFIAGVISAQLLRKLFGIMLILSGSVTLLKKEKTISV